MMVDECEVFNLLTVGDLVILCAMSGTNYLTTSCLPWTLQGFCSRLKTRLFSRSFPDFLLCLWSDLCHYCTL